MKLLKDLNHEPQPVVFLNHNRGTWGAYINGKSYGNFTSIIIFNNDDKNDIHQQKKKFLIYFLNKNL